MGNDRDVMIGRRMDADYLVIPLSTLFLYFPFLFLFLFRFLVYFIFSGFFFLFFGYLEATYAFFLGTG